MVVSPGFNTPFTRFFSYFIVKIQKIQTELSLGVLTPIIVEIEAQKINCINEKHTKCLKLNGHKTINTYL